VQQGLLVRVAEVVVIEEWSRRREKRHAIRRVVEPCWQKPRFGG
jgi:hypothetical protein